MATQLGLGALGRQKALCAASPLTARQRYRGSVVAEVLQSQDREQLESELFGLERKLHPMRLTSQIKAARSWPEARTALTAACNQDLTDTTFITAALNTLPKVLRRSRLSASEQSAVQELVRRLVQQQLEPRLAELDAQGLLAITVGLAKLEYRDQGLFQQLALCSMPALRAGCLGPSALSSLAWALAASGTRPTGAWLSLFWAQLEQQAEQLQGQDCANILWSVCRLELMPPWVGSSSASSLIPHTLRCMAQAESGQDPATVLVCMAIWYRTWAYRPPEPLLADMLAHMAPRLPAYRPEDLVSVVHSLVVINHQPGRAWMTAFYAALRERLTCEPTLSYADFQRLLWALSRIDYVPSQGWLKQFVEVSRGKLHQLRLRALSELAWALACWGYTPTPEWLAEYFRVTQPKLQEYKPHHLAISVTALKKMGCKVPACWLDGALHAFCQQLPDAKAHDLVSFLDGIVELADNAAWMSAPETGRALRSLADFAASKFDICDCLMHAKLLVALTTAQCCPGPAWLRAQQASLARSLGAAQPGAQPLDNATASELCAAYAAWDVPLSPSLAQELGLKPQ
ncbi:hypothetical protein QJQ45_021573 [Haematococcus lacustris]|nr:hypothetical protein QJQ45_021573 [Haematococcus lacustris]